MGFTLIGCGKLEPPPPSPQLAVVTKERDRERAARIEAEAEAARHKAESHNTTLMFGVALGCTVALFAGIALGSSAHRRSSASTALHRGQADEKVAVEP